MPEAVPVARDEARAAAVHLEESPKAVIFDLEEPIGMIEGFGSPFQNQRRDLWKSGRRVG
jgi:hypothetical protein